MSSYKVEIDEIKKRVIDNRMEQARLQEKLSSLTKQRDEILNELKTLGVDPNTIDQWIEKEEQQIKEGLETCKNMMNITQA